MTIEQLLFSVIGLMAAQTGIIVTILILYINAKIDGKIDPLSKQVDTLVQYMVSHEGRISRLEERTSGTGKEG